MYILTEKKLNENISQGVTSADKIRTICHQLAINRRLSQGFQPQTGLREILEAMHEFFFPELNDSFIM